MEEPFIDFHDDEGYYTDEELTEFVIKNYCEDPDSILGINKSSTEEIPSPYQFF
jgi:hypothetical protein